ncbi:heptaprenylglyceryl phosphate synthase [Psychrobacillus psychrodurans]|uniref:heptaprenylglyceryl phosphate synthase n=1 Tax=Psychrobacillus psychrodurans TaxID=126157 RepID=UPI0008ED98CC|nr:heptaprenylglyceryl phosphate synthase [Psychrobacillus psychrodurans]MCZ8540451.1 heptaprenylglyceryl phosphate synthase [Psychrobacillus psychrodurans]SFM70115.1 putative glycerol-1-phosphate prenyltransferase [Psychrobacillus psychrodurans]
MEYKDWRHIFKLDPAKPIGADALEKICESGTDAIIIGGSDNVTLDNVIDLLMRIRRYAVPVALEVSTIESITPGFDYYFIPSVLNSPETKWVKDLHHAATKEFGEVMNWDEIIPEGYCILNPDCKAAKLTNAVNPSSEEDIIAYAEMVEYLFKFPVFYMEYSGMYGNVETVKKVKNRLKKTKLFYGGGILTEEHARQMATYADTIIVGNQVYDNLAEALKTVQAVKTLSKQ